MKNDSLIKALLIIFDTIDKSDINTQDKLELLINLRSFLNVDKYENNIKILSKGGDKR